MSASVTYRRLVALMSAYLSPASVAATLSTVLEKERLSAAELGPGDLPEVVAEAMVGLRLFCDPERLPDLMVDLAELCEESASPPRPPSPGRGRLSPPSAPSRGEEGEDSS